MWECLWDVERGGCSSGGGRVRKGEVGYREGERGKVSAGRDARGDGILLLLLVSGRGRVGV